MRRLLILALAVAVALAAFVSPFASSHPDGLERVAIDKGFAQRAEAPQAAPAPDYAFPGVESGRLANGAAGAAGALLVFALGSGTVVALRRRRVR